MPYRIEGLAPAPFRHLFALDDAALAERNIQRSFAGEGTPCRVSLADAAPGDEVLLLGHAHLDATSPYRASGPIFVRRHAVEEQDDALVLVDTVPDVLATRLLSVRAYDAGSCIRTADVVEGSALGRRIEDMFVDDGVRFLHVHYARHGCYAARVMRG